MRIDALGKHLHVDEGIHAAVLQELNKAAMEMDMQALEPTWPQALCQSTQSSTVLPSCKHSQGANQSTWCKPLSSERSSIDAETGKLTVK